MNEYRESGGFAPPILNPGPRWRLVVNFTLRPHYPMKDLLYPLKKKLD